MPQKIMPQQVTPSTVADSPFNLSNEKTYKQWRDVKLRYTTPALTELTVAVNNPYQLSDNEKQAIIERCDCFNMAIYQLSDPEMQDKTLVLEIGKQLGMRHLDANLRADEDSVTSLQVSQQTGNQYIPYTNKALSWHTDGYYNHLDKQIFGIIMHCVTPADKGGINRLLNPENVYIKLRDENPAYIEALMHPEAMTIPDNVEAGEVIRAAQAGPVFLVKPPVGSGAGRLHMRFSARKRNIIWRDTEDTRKAVAMINQIMADDNNVVKLALKAGQGIICNNVLHNRSGFTDSESKKRLMYRARYYDAVG
jgi:alpha-ketoglutarate-dependent taurine dioxygenase